MSAPTAGGRARASAISRTGGRYRTAPALPSRALQLGRFIGLAKETARNALDLLRTTIHRFRWLRIRTTRIERYLATQPVRKVHLGAGPVLLPGWLNADLRPRMPEHIFIDVTERFPFSDQSIDYIFTEHLIGDLTYPQAGSMLAECHRVLRPGGRLRIGTPNLARLAELYRPDAGEIHERYVSWAIEEFVGWADAPLPGLVINNLFQEHPFLYDPATLRHVLGRAGFVNIIEQPFGRSTDPHLDDVDSHGRVLGHAEISAFESLTMEAERA